MGTTYDNFLGHSFYFEDGHSFCRVCSVKVSWEGWAQHIHGKVKDRKTSHLTQLEVRDRVRPFAAKCACRPCSRRRV